MIWGMKKKIFAFLLSAFSLIAVVFSSGCAEKTMLFGEIKKNETVVGYELYWVEIDVTEFVVPEEFNKLPVVSISPALCNSYPFLESVVLPNTIKTIADGAFQCTHLKRVTFGNSIKKIEYHAFWECEALADVYFYGTENDWQSIEIGEGNESLTKATIHYLTV